MSKGCREDVLFEIMLLESKRRKDVAICVALLIAIIIIVTAEILLTASGAIPADHMIVNAIVAFSSIGLAVLGGSSGINFMKSGRRIAYLSQTNGLDEKKGGGHQGVYNRMSIGEMH